MNFTSWTKNVREKLIFYPSICSKLACGQPRLPQHSRAPRLKYVKKNNKKSQNYTKKFQDTNEICCIENKKKNSFKKVYNLRQGENKKP